jgi:hypothetical protein
MRWPLLRSRVISCFAGAVAVGAVFVQGCASEGAGNTFEALGDGGGGRGAGDASALDGASTGSNPPVAGDATPATGDDGSSTTMDDGSSSADDGGTGSTCQAGSCPPEGGTTPTCVTTLPAPKPVCDSKEQYCVCTADSQCNSNGLNVVNNGGCNSRKCSGAGPCTGGQNVDSAGCSIVGPTCNLGGNQGCPAKTTCEINHGGCGGQFQCCWCTGDAACGVSGKCVNDTTEKQCAGLGPCTGSGTEYDGMHCELVSPGIPMCTLQ